MIQLVTPNPNISCQPGWCLQYVRQTFGAPAVEPTATAGWANAKFRHEDWDFPAGCWVPVWFSLAKEPAGHVALMAPDGSVYSTSDDSTVPHHHPSLQDLIAYYWRNPLTYLGWSEDISGVRVVQGDGTINVQSITTTPISSTSSQEDFMGGLIDAQQAEDIVNAVVQRVVAALDNQVRINAIQAESIVQATTARTAALVDANANGKTINAQQADDIAQAAANYNQAKDAGLYNKDTK